MTLVCARQCANLAGDAYEPEPCGVTTMSMTNRSGSGNGTGFSRTALTTVKIAVLVPMPSVSAAIAASVNAGLALNILNECARSRRKPFIDTNLQFGR